jgi:hypothetical protein
MCGRLPALKAAVVISALEKASFIERSAGSHHRPLIFEDRAVVGPPQGGNSWGQALAKRRNPG